MPGVYEIAANKNDGTKTTLKEQGEGKVLLVVNVASKCGLTTQYNNLENLYNKYKDQGFSVAAFPSNDFLGQEPGSDQEIKDFCTTKFNVTFPIYQKISVKGGDTQHPLYTQLTSEVSESTISNGGIQKKLADLGLPPREGNDIIWNFEKFIVDKHGKVVARIDPDIEPNDSRVIAVIEAELAKN